MPAAEIGCPRYDAAIVPYYQKTSGLVGLQTKRGCPHGCAYCSYPLIEGARVRHRDPREVVDDLETLRRDYGVDNVFFTDSIFNDAGGGHLALAEEMLRRGTNIRWASFFRPQRLERAQLRLLKSAGLYALELGTDAADDTTLAAPGQGLHLRRGRPLGAGVRRRGARGGPLRHVRRAGGDAGDRGARAGQPEAAADRGGLRVRRRADLPDDAAAAARGRGGDHRRGRLAAAPHLLHLARGAASPSWRPRSPPRSRSAATGSSPPPTSGSA